jgi:hypothetical protein
MTGKRELKLKISLEALNVIMYPDRMATSLGANSPTTSDSPGAPQVQSASTQSAEKIENLAFGESLPPNPNIDAPYNTFIYGGMTNNNGFDLLAEPSTNKAFNFPFSEKYGSRLKTPSETQNFRLIKTQNFESISPTPIMPSRSALVEKASPKLTTYNFWVHTDENNNYVSENITYYKGNDPVYGSDWKMGTINQTTDEVNQAAIQVDSFENKAVYIRRSFSQRFDSLYEDDATIVYPDNSGIANTRFNFRDGTRIIDPRENLGFMMNFTDTEFLGKTTDKNSNKGVKVKWGDIDTHQDASQNNQFIEYYEIIWTDNATPLLKFWHPVDRDYRELRLRGPLFSGGTNKLYVHYVGQSLMIGFDENISKWNVIGPVEPKGGEEFKVLYHLTPGARNNIKKDSGVAVSFDNTKTKFKYSAMAFKNIVINGQSDKFDFFSDEADEHKIQDQHKFAVSAEFLKKLSQSTRLNDFFHGKSGRLQERLNNTPEYVRKKNSKYFFDSDTLTENVDRDLATISYARDWRMASPFSTNYGDVDSGNPWEIKTKILEPNYDTVDQSDSVTYNNTQVAFIFDSPVYSPVFFELNTYTMPVDDINLDTQQNLQQTQDEILEQNNDVSLIKKGTPSFDGENGAVNTPIFPFKWGDITDLVKSDRISITHSIGADGIGRSNTSISLPNLINSNRGNNILNMIENNQFVLKIQAGYDSSAVSGNRYGGELPTYFEGVIRSVDTTRTPNGSTTTLQCQDWFSYVLDESKSFSTFSLQGVRVRDRIKIALRLSGLENYYQILDRQENLLKDDPSDYTDQSQEEDKAFAVGMSFRQGNATSKSAAQNLSEVIDIDNALASFVSESIQFVLDDRAIACIYGNNRNDNLRRIEDGNVEDTTGRKLKVVAENRFLRDPLEPVIDSTAPSDQTRYRDDFKYLVEPSKMDHDSDNAEFISGLIDSERFQDLSIDEFHRTIVTGIRTNSTTSGLYEGVYLLAVGIGSIPIFHVRSSDSYFIDANSNLGELSATGDSGMYATGNNRILKLTFPFGFKASTNTLDFLNNFDVNNEDEALNAAKYRFGYVGFRKRFFDDLRQTYIQTQPDLVERGDLWAQYIRKVVQNIQFTSIVTRPLEHYSNFKLKDFSSVGHNNSLNVESISKEGNTRTGPRGTFPSVFNEFQNFLYSQVIYNIDKSKNIISADVQGGVVPKFGTMALDENEQSTV